MRRLQHSLKIAVGPRGCRDDSPVFSYRFARALSYIIGGSLESFPRGAHDPRHGVNEIYIHPLVASINIFSKISFAFASWGETVGRGKAIPLLPVAKVSFAEKKSRGWSRSSFYTGAKWPLISCGNSISLATIPSYRITWPRFHGGG